MIGIHTWHPLNMVLCDKCTTARAIMKRPKTGQRLCRNCFYSEFESEVHDTIVTYRLFQRGEKVAIGASGGKDSVVLAYVLKLLNQKYDYGLSLYLLSIDEGIAGYRDDSLKAVMRNRDSYQLPLKILSYPVSYTHLTLPTTPYV